MAAEQAVALARCTLHVVPSRSVPEGIAAALAFDAARSVAENVETMLAAVASVQTVEVTQAAADRTADGVTMSAGDDIALLDGRLVAAACSPLDALLAGLAKAEVAAANLITIYAGAVFPARNWSKPGRRSWSDSALMLKAYPAGRNSMHSSRLSSDSEPHEPAIL